jgi:hypothetical protein
MNGRQGAEPLSTQADWSGLGDMFAQALSFGGSPVATQPSLLRPAFRQAPQAQPSPPPRPVSLIPQRLQRPSPLPAQAAPLPPGRPTNLAPLPVNAAPVAADSNATPCKPPLLSRSICPQRRRLVRRQDSRQPTIQPHSPVRPRSRSICPQRRRVPRGPPTMVTGLGNFTSGPLKPSQRRPRLK